MSTILLIEDSDSQRALARQPRERVLGSRRVGFNRLGDGGGSVTVTGLTGCRVHECGLLGCELLDEEDIKLEVLAGNAERLFE